MFQTKRAMGNPYGDDTIDIRELLSRFTKRWWWFVVATIFAGGISFMMLRSAMKIYRVKATIILNDQSNEATSAEQMLKNLRIPVPQKEIPNEIGMLSSFRLIKQTVSKMDVGISYFSVDKFKTRAEYKDVPYSIEVDSGHVQLVGLPIYIDRISETEYRVRAKGENIQLYDIRANEIQREIGKVQIDRIVKVGEPFENNQLSFQVHFKPDYDTYRREEYYFKIATLDGLADGFRASLKVNLVNEDANIIELVHEGALVEVSKKFINQLLEEYKADGLAKKRDLGEKTREVLLRQISDVSGEITSVEGNITGTRSGSGIYDPRLSSGNLSIKINQLENDRANERVKQEYYTQLLFNLENNPDVNELPAPSSLGVNDQVLTNLILQLSKLNEEYVSLRHEVTDNSPLLQVSELKIKNTRRAIIANVKSGLRAVEIKLDDINQRLGLARSEANKLPIIDQTLANRNRNLATSEERYKDLKEQLDYIELALETVSVDMEVIDSPKMDGYKPIKPKKSFYMLIAIFIGCGIPAVLIIVLDFFDKRISGLTDIEASTNIPLLGFIARHDRNSSYIVPKDSRTALAESFRSVRIKLQYLNDEGGPQQVIGLTSSSSGEGKTFCATNLAAVFAQAGRRTLLVDVDLRRPRVTRYFENGDGRGLSTFLIGEVTDPYEIVHKTHIENLDVIHSGPICTNPLDLVSTDHMTRLIETFRGAYDHIILDTPPVGLVSDYLVIMKLTDFNIYVVRDTTTNVDSLRMINELYDSEKIKNVSLLINDVKSLSNYGYIDKYYGYGDD